MESGQVESLKHAMRTSALLLAALSLAVAACAPKNPPRAAAPVAKTPASLDPILQPYLAKYRLPALAAAIVQNGELVAVGAVGTRRAGADIPVTVNDRFHIGSDTKAMTALVAAQFVDEGKLRWDITVVEVFPELAPKMDKRLRQVTLEQLLSHTSGIPSDNDALDTLIEQGNEQPGNLDEMRYCVVERLVKMPLDSQPGTRFAYANLGYVLVGAILERKSGKTWEELVQERVFTPLQLDTAGFGPQASLGKIDAPLAHRPQKDGALKAMLAGPNGDNPPVLGPAGTAHLSVIDFATWAAWNTGEGKRGPALVKPETMHKMHTPIIEMAPKKDAAPGTPASGKYGLGWGEITIPPLSPEPFVFHGGSNQMNLAYIMLQPKYDFGMVLMTNAGGTEADAGLKALSAELYGKYGNRDSQ